ncbi:hypothetical protein UlMin_011988 [Ulmus minor]
MSQSPLSSILNQNKLTGDNFADWKMNLLIVISFEKHKYVLGKDCPPIPNENSPSGELLAYANWLDSNEIARCYMMADMTSVLQKQHEGYKTAREIMNNVEDMFSGQSLLIRQAAVRNLMNCKHMPGTPIKDHILTMIGYLAEAQNHGSEIDSDTQMEMIFESLSNEFIPFRTIFNLSGKNMSLTELMKQLQAFESMIKSKGIEVNFD